LYFRDQTNPYHTKILVKTFLGDHSGRFFPPSSCFALLRLWGEPRVHLSMSLKILFILVCAVLVRSMSQLWTFSYCSYSVTGVNKLKSDLILVETLIRNQTRVIKLDTHSSL